MASTMPTSATGGIHTLATARHKMLKIFFIAFMITHFSYQCQPRQSDNNSDGWQMGSATAAPYASRFSTCVI
jgi:hypothetical protein